MDGRRFISLLLAACLLLTTLSASVAAAAIPVPASGIEKSTYTEPALDGSQSAWAEPELVAAYQYGLTFSTVMKTFRKNITREEFCRLAVRLYERLTGETAAIVDNPFTDTNSSDILKAYGLRIVNGVAADRFAPGAFITRQELSVMVHRALKATFGDLDEVENPNFTFSDAAKIATWAREQMEYCHVKGIINGIGNNQIGPLGNTTREQAIAIIYRTFCQFAEPGTAEPPIVSPEVTEPPVSSPDSAEMLGMSALEAGDAALPEELSEEDRFAYFQELGVQPDERLVLFGSTGSDLPASVPDIAGHIPATRGENTAASEALGNDSNDFASNGSGISSSGEMAWSTPVNGMDWTIPESSSGILLDGTSDIGALVVRPPIATIAPSLPNVTLVRPLLPDVQPLPTGSVYTSAQGGVFVDETGDMSRWFAFRFTDSSGISNVAWQVSDRPFPIDDGWKTPDRLLLSGQVSASSGRFSVDFSEVVQNLRDLDASNGITPIPQQLKRFYVRAVPVNGRGGIVGDPGAGLAVLVGSAAPDTSINWSTSAAFDLWTPKEGAGGYRGEFQDIPEYRSMIGFSPRYEEFGRMFHFHLPNGEWSQLVIQVSSKPFTAAMNWPASAGLVNEKTLTPEQGKTEIDSRYEGVSETYSSTAMMVRFRDFCPPEQEMQAEEYLRYYVRGIALKPGSAPGTLEPVYSSVVTVDYGYATPIVLLQPANPVYDYVDRSLPQIDFTHYEPAHWPDKEYLQHYVVYRAPAANEILFTWVNAGTGERLYPYFFYEDMYDSQGIHSAAEYEQQVIPKVLPVGATVYVPTPADEDEPWYEELWDGLTEFFSVLATIGEALVNTVANSYNNLKASIVHAVGSLCPIPSLREEFEAALEMLVDTGLASLGLPPSLPNFDQLTSMSLDYMAEVALQEAGIPAEQITGPILKEVATGIGKDIAAAANHSDPNLLGSPFLKLNPEKQYRPAYVDIHVSNNSKYTTVAGSVRLEVTFEFDYWSMYANPYDPNDGITLTAGNKYGYGSSAAIGSSMDYMNHFFYGLNGYSVDFAQGEKAVYDVFVPITDVRLPSLLPGESTEMRIYLTPNTGGAGLRYPGGEGSYYEDFENMYFGNGSKAFSWFRVSGMFPAPLEWMAERKLLYIPSEPAAQLSYRPGGNSDNKVQKPLTLSWNH